METKQRFTGIDLFRGVAAYAVIIIHAEHSAAIPGSWAAKLVSFSLIAVPFFLAVSFYLTMNSLYVRGSKCSLKSRINRILIPFWIWSAIYIFQRVLESLILKKISINSIFDDPLGIIFFGSAAYHLYFLPILFTGNVVVKFTSRLIKAEVYVLILLFATSIFAYNLCLASGNSYQLATATSFQSLLAAIYPDGNKNPLLRLVLVEFSWVLRCLPYIFMAMILNHPSIRGYLSRLNTQSTITLFAVFFIINAFGNLFLPEAVYEIARGYSALLFSISLSVDIEENAILKNLSLCSFDIYLVHLLVLHLFQSIAKRVYPGSENIPPTLISILVLSTLSFLVSWMIAHLLNRNRFFAKNRSVDKFSYTTPLMVKHQVKAFKKKYENIRSQSRERI